MTSGFEISSRTTEFIHRLRSVVLSAASCNIVSFFFRVFVCTIQVLIALSFCMRRHLKWANCCSRSSTLELVMSTFFLTFDLGHSKHSLTCLVLSFDSFFVLLYNLLNTLFASVSRFFGARRAGASEGNYHIVNFVIRISDWRWTWTKRIRENGHSLQTVWLRY